MIICLAMDIIVNVDLPADALVEQDVGDNPTQRRKKQFIWYPRVDVELLKLGIS